MCPAQAVTEHQGMVKGEETVRGDPLMLLKYLGQRLPLKEIAHELAALQRFGVGNTGTRSHLQFTYFLDTRDCHSGVRAASPTQPFSNKLHWQWHTV